MNVIHQLNETEAHSLTCNNNPGHILDEINGGAVLECIIVKGNCFKR